MIGRYLGLIRVSSSPSISDEERKGQRIDFAYKGSDFGDGPQILNQVSLESEDIVYVGGGMSGGNRHLTDRTRTLAAPLLESLVVQRTLRLGSGSLRNFCLNLPRPLNSI